MIHPFPGNCTWRSKIGGVWMSESVFRGSGELFLQALSLPHTWYYLGIPSKTALPSPTLYPFCAAGGHTYVCCHHHKWGELLGAEGTRSLHTTSTSTNASLQPLKPGYLSPGDVLKPTLWGSSHAVWRPSIFAFKILVFFCYLAVAEWLWAFKSFWSTVGESIFLLLGVSRGDKHSQTPEKMFLFDKRQCDGEEWNCSSQSSPNLLKTKCERRD